MILLLGLLLSSPAPATLPATALSEIDALYLKRDRPGNLDRSTQVLEDAVKADAADEAALWRLGRVRVAQAEAASERDRKLALFSQAETALGGAVRLSPGDAQAHYWLAREMGGSNAILRTLRLARSMRRELETAIRLDPGHAAAHRLLGELLRQLPGIVGGDKKKAVAELEQALKLAPNDTANYPALAEGYLAVGRKQDAVDVLKKAFLVQSPDDPAAAAQDLQDSRDLLRKLTEPKRQLWKRLTSRDVW